MRLDRYFVAAIVPGRCTAEDPAAWAGPGRIFTATVQEWADPTLQQAVIAVRPYGHLDSVLYTITEGADYAMYRVSGIGLYPWTTKDGLALYRTWLFQRLITPASYQYDMLHCYLAAMNWDDIIFLPTNMAAWRECE